MDRAGHHHSLNGFGVHKNVNIGASATICPAAGDTEVMSQRGSGYEPETFALYEIIGRDSRG
jgi:hypothetical protein